MNARFASPRHLFLTSSKTKYVLTVKRSKADDGERLTAGSDDVYTRLFGFVSTVVTTSKQGFKSYEVTQSLLVKFRISRPRLSPLRRVIGGLRRLMNFGNSYATNPGSPHYPQDRPCRGGSDSDNL